MWFPLHAAVTGTRYYLNSTENGEVKMQFSTLSLKSSFQNSWLIFKSHLRRFGLESLLSPHPVTRYGELQAGRHRPLHPISAPSCFSSAAQLGHPRVLPPIALAKQAARSCQGVAAQPGRGDGAQPWPRRSPAGRSALSPGTQMDPCPHLLGTSSLSAS